MPKKPLRDKAGFHTHTSPRSSASLLGSLLQRSAITDVAAEKTSQSSQLHEALRAALPAGLAVHLQAARLHGNELVLFARSAAWAGRLKLATVELVAAGRAPAGLPPGVRIVARLMPASGFRR